jgi:hypothetical protein
MNFYFCFVCLFFVFIGKVRLAAFTLLMLSSPPIHIWQVIYLA